MDRMNELYARIESEIENYKELAALAKAKDHGSAQDIALTKIETLEEVLDLIKKIG